MSTTPKDNPGVIAFPPLIVFLCLGFGGVAHWLHPVPLLDPMSARIAGGFIIILALGLLLWARSAMVRVGTNIRPDKPALALTAAGPFVYTRNPMYVGLCLLHLGGSLLINGVLPLLFLAPLVLTLHFGVIKREERYLTAKFGESYLAYLRQVRRWI